MKNLLNYEFEFIENLSPVKDRDGLIKEFYPQEKYAKKEATELNKHGDGAFCRFSIHPKWSSISGVYAFFIDDELVYIGQCLDFAKRFNLGYGNISPRCCYKKGQSTNCKINKVVLENVKAGKTVAIYFHRSGDYDKIERELIEHYKPEYNSSLVGAQSNNQTNRKRSQRKISNSGSAKKGSTEDIRQYITDKIKAAKEAGANECIFVSGDIHNEMGLRSRLPTVCNAMYQLMKTDDEILYSTPSGRSSTIKIKYKIY